jgi:hypothetical protein
MNGSTQPTTQSIQQPSVSPLSGRARGSGLTDFLNSNSLVARISFLLLVILIFVVVLQISIQIIGMFFSHSTSPHLIDGMVDAKQLIIIPQDPSSNGAKTISRSVNDTTGIEFSWSVWIFIDDLQYQEGQYRHIFHKGNSNISTDPDTKGLNFPNNAPGLYIAPNTNELVVIMNTYNVINEEIDIPDIPLNKWVNVIIRCRNTTLDVYINGTITKSTQLLGVPKQNYGDVYVAMNGGFSGYISNLWYYNYALGTTAIQSLVKGGPSTKMSSSSAMSMINPNYLSLRWYFYGGQ